ncbi:MAG TPA: rhodanese-like domain-containing protein [Geminicoccaceae bacterium]|nr:rhodanese-like domain-containing protein [Geminicoccaceae bacterium]
MAPLTDPLPLEIAPADLARLRAGAEPYALLDVREPWEIAISGLAEAIHLPLGELDGRVHELPRDRPLIVVCHTGRRSLLATQYLRQSGLSRAVNLRGGVEAYALEVDPGMARY